MIRNLLSRQQQLCLFITLLTLLTAGTNTWAQQKPARPQGCGHLTMQKDLIKRSNSLLQQQIKKASELLEKDTKEFGIRSKTQGTAQTILTIPVVFHVVHDGGIENIADAQMIDAIAQINEDFRAQNSGAAGVADDFKGIVADVGFQFALAQKDPNGNPTTGITRTRSSHTYNGGNIGLKELIKWPREKYLNIWVVRSSNGSNGSAFAFYPSSTTGSNSIYDGVVSSHWAVGRTGTAVATHYKILTHEIGHWANLKHIWGDQTDNGADNACNDDDGVSDTPNTKGNTGCDLTSATCNSLDNSQNYMDYGTCTVMFTEGQKTRMLATMNSSVAERNNIWSEANLAATLYSSPTPRLLFAKTTFAEGIANDGSINEKIAINLVDGATFSVASGELSASDFSITGLPAGLTAKITVLSNTSAELSLSGSVADHAKANSLSDASVTFNTSAFGVAASNLTTSGVGIDFIDPYVVIYKDVDDIQVTTSAVWTSFNLGFGDAKYGIFYNASKTSFQIESYTKEAICAAGTRNVTPLAFNTTIDGASQWEAGGSYPDLLDVSNADHTAWNGQAAYVGIKFSNSGNTHYGWLKLEVAADGSSYKLLEYGYHQQPDAPIRAGQSMLDTGDASVSATSFKEEANANNGAVAGTVTVGLLNGISFNNASGELTAGTHFTASNVPAGLTAKITVTNATTAELSFAGNATSHDEVNKVTDVKITLKAVAVSGSNDLPLPDLSISFIDVYQIVYRDINPDYEVNTANVWKFFRMDVGNAEYGLFYNAGKASFQLETYGKSIVSAAGTRNITPITLNTAIGADSQWEAGGAYPDLHDVSNATYTDWNGKTAYVGVQFTIDGNTHYGWLKIQVAADGSSYKLLEHAYHEQPNTPIKAGQTEIDDNGGDTLPVAAFSADSLTIFVGHKVSFTDESTGTPTDWVWTFDGGVITSGGARNPVVMYNETGVYSVTLTVSNADGTNTLTKTQYITAVAPPAPIAAFSANVTNIKTGESVIFTDESVNNPTSWAWTFDGGTPAASTEQNPTITYDTPGFYQVTLTATNAIGASVAIKTAYIVVRPACDYCSFASGRADFEYIAGVKVGEFNNTSDGAKFSNFREKIITMVAGQDNAIELTPGFAGAEYEDWSFAPFHFFLHFTCSL